VKMGVKARMGTVRKGQEGIGLRVPGYAAL
jgi:hypothetical protein